jgi:hypothetical protein
MIFPKDVFQKIPNLDEKSIESAIYIFQKITNIFPNIPQEGLRCKPYISIEIGAILLKKKPISRSIFAKASILSLNSYNKYLELFLNGIEADGETIINKNYLLEILEIQEFGDQFNLIFDHLDSFSQSSQDQRIRLVVSLFFLSEIIGKPISFENCCSLCCCFNECSFGLRILKTMKTKYKEFFNNLKKSRNNRMCLRGPHEKQSNYFESFNKLGASLEFCGFIELT